MTSPVFSLPVLSPTMWALIFAVSAGLILWLLSLRLRDSSIVDIFWGPGIAMVVDLVAWLGHSGGERTSAVLFLVNLWGVRLAAYLWSRHRGEDRRYAALRNRFGRNWWWLSLPQLFLLQAILIWFVPAPLVAAVLYGQRPLVWLDYLGIGLAAFGLLFEAVADFQLSAFRADPANRTRVMDRGLWRWSRHPNYFGDAAMWWGYFAIGFSASHMWWLILSPLLVTFLLLQVSGVTLLEDGIEDRRPAYAQYRRRVSAFLPWWPRQ